eukprot:gene13480-18085_t
MSSSIAAIPSSEKEIEGVQNNENEEADNKKKSILPNPYKVYKAYKAKKRLELEKEMLLREENMKQDLERYLMQNEEYSSWLNYELRIKNYNRMKRVEIVMKKLRDEMRRSEEEEIELSKENGVSYFKGSIINNKKFQNSGAKCLDLNGHSGAIYTCKLSHCLSYVLSCSEDKTAKVWNVRTGECLITYSGHTKRINDCDFHPEFHPNLLYPCVITCSSDCTMKLWNGSTDASCVLTIKGHSQSIYRCSFSPDGKSMISCSEDKTVRTWCYPEGYLLFIYRGHQSPVTTVNISPTGRYILSGSDYGERKLLLWDAKLPVMTDPQHYPHIIHWSPLGVIKKILFKPGTPKLAFWLKKTELNLIQDDKMLDIWPAELEDDLEIKSESTVEEEEKDEEEDEEELKRIEAEKEKNRWGKDDIKEKNGVRISVISTSHDGEQTEAIEYIPGGELIISLQSQRKPISEAFIDIVVRDTRFDSFSPKSGFRLGQFQLNAPIPNKTKSEDMVLDPRNLLKNKPQRKIPYGLYLTASDQAFIYDENIRFEKTKNHENAENVLTTEFETIWKCPTQSFLGSAIVNVNFKFRKSSQWIQLTYSLKESRSRIESTENDNKYIDDNNSTTGNNINMISNTFSFDQEERHQKFFEYIRDKNWEAVASFVDKKSVLYEGLTVHKRKWRVMNFIATVFDSSNWIILHNPIIFSDGVTKSVAICETDYNPEKEILDDFIIEEKLPIDNIIDVNNDNINIIENGNSDILQEVEDENLIMQEGLIVDDGKDSQPIEEVNKTNNDIINRSNSGNDESWRDDMEESFRTDSMEEHKNERNQVSHTLTINVSPVKVGGRAKTSIPDRPQVIYRGDVEGKEFFRIVKARVKEEANNIEQMIMNDIPVVNQVRLYGIDVDLVLKKFENIKQRPTWLSEYMNEMNEKNNNPSDEIQYSSKITTNQAIKDMQTLVNQIKAKKDHDNFTSIKLPYHEYIKTNKYGPEVSDFSMPLPVIFPQHAGEAKHALRVPLEEYEKKLSKLRKESLPTRLSDINEMTAMQRINDWYNNKVLKIKEKKVKANLENSLRIEIMLYILNERCYFSNNRRETYVILPGLEGYNPNPLYTSPALLFHSVNYFPQNIIDDMNLKPTVSNSLSNLLFGRKLQQSTQAPPVGRKVRPEQLTYFKKYNQTNDDLESPPVTSSSVRTDNFILPELNAPPNVFLGRRLAYPMLPGLQSFIEYMAKDSEGLRINSTTTGLTPKAITTIVASPSMKSKSNSNVYDSLMNPTGLMRRFRVHGFELAHHGSINDTSFAPTESRLASAGGDGLIKIWDPRDGSYVMTLKGHHNEVLSVKYSSNEQFLVSSGADREILIWSMINRSLNRRLLGHVDVVYGVAISPDCSLIVSCSHDATLKTWYTTPRHPDPPNQPIVIQVTDTTALVTWTAPPSYNCEINAFHLQWRVGLREKWYPPDCGLSLPPQYRSRVIKNLLSAAYYQFRIRAQNRMGLSPWSDPSKLTRTNYGIPELLEMPIICGVTLHSMSMFWFAQNPKTYGSASTSFQVQCAGNGLKFEDNKNPFEIILKDASEFGRLVLKAMKKKYDAYLNTKDLIIIKQRKIKSENHDQEEVAGEDDNELEVNHPIGDELEGNNNINNNKSNNNSNNKVKSTIELHNNNNEIEEILPDLIHDVSIDMIEKILERASNPTVLFVACEYKNLVPGFMYIFRTRGVNVAGFGEWSKHTYSSYTLPDKPAAPSPPRIETAGLRNIKFVWDPPSNTGGSAITKYIIELKNLNRTFELPRHMNYYNWDGLFPGRSYRIRVKCCNIVNESEFSDWNDSKESYTITAPPDKPLNPLAVAGTWNSLTVDARMPYSNGSAITEMIVQQRIIQPFEKSDWFAPPGKPVFRIPSDIEYVEYIDLLSQQQEIEDKVHELEMKKSSGGFAKYNMKEKQKIDQQIQNLISNQ